MEVAELLEDAFRFLRTYAAVINSAPLQLYFSLLLFSPHKSRIKQLFQEDIDWVAAKAPVADNWSQCLQILEGHGAIVKSSSFMNNSKSVISCGQDGTARIWRVDTGECVQTFNGLVPLSSIAVSRDSLQFAAEFSPGELQIRNTDTGDCYGKINGHSSGIDTVAFSHDSELLMSVSNKIARLWKLSTSACLHTFSELETSAFSISHDSKLIVFGSTAGEIRVWSVVKTEWAKTLSSDPKSVRLVMFSHDSKVLASSNGTEIRMWNVSTGACLRQLDGHSDQVLAIAFSHDSMLMASASIDESVRIWRSSTGECLNILQGHTEAIFSVSFSHDSTLVLSSSSDETIRIWRPNSNYYGLTDQNDKEGIQSIRLSQDDRLIASSSSDKTVRIWDVGTGICMRSFSDHEDIVTAVTFSHDMKLVASASLDRTVCIWNVEENKCLHKLTAYAQYATAVSFSHDSAFLASAGDDGEIKIFHTLSGKKVQWYYGHSNTIEFITFSHDSSLLASASWDSTVRLWRSNMVTPIRELRGHTKAAVSVIFSPDSKTVASSSVDNTIRIWEVNTGGCVQVISTTTAASLLRFNPEISRVVTDLGAFIVQRSKNRDLPNYSASQLLHQSLGFAIIGSWVTWNGRNLLWLPVEFRPNETEISGPIIAIGCTSGNLVILRFNCDKMYFEMEKY